jgi:hypothetical protein
MWWRKRTCRDSGTCPGLEEAQRAQALSARALDEVQRLTPIVEEMGQEMREFIRVDQVSLRLMAMMRREDEDGGGSHDVGQ